MKRRLALAVLPVIALVVAGTGDSTSAAPGASQTTSGEPWTGSPGVTVPVSTLMARQRSEDRRRAGEPPAVRERPEPGGRQRQPTSAASRAPRLRTGSAAVAPKSELTAGTSFLGAHRLETPTNFVPPDTIGSVGPTQVLVAVNGRIRVFDKNGTNTGVLDVTDGTFWSSVNAGLDVTDPQVEYDRLSGRWILSQINFDPSDPSMTNNRIMVAVSSGSTITSSSDFTFYFFNQNGPNPGPTARFADYPQMGVDANAVYIGTNEFSAAGGFTGTTAYVIRKSSVTGGGPIVVTAFRGLISSLTGAGPFTPQPAQDMDPSVGEGYLVGVDNAQFGKLDVRRITTPGGTPSISGNLTVNVPTTTFPESVPAQGSPHKLDPLDDRLFEAMIGRDENGTLSLWTAHNIEVNSSGNGSSTGGRDGARWYQLGNLSTTPTLLQSGTLFDPTSPNPRYFWIPSIAMNGQGHASLNSSMAGSGRFAEVASSAHLASDPLDTTEPFDTTQTSSSTYNLGDNPERWGDYSQTVVDPTDNQTFWTFQEYTNATNDWGVRVIKLLAPPPATPSAASPSTVALGQSSVTVQVTGTSANGSGFFDPGPDTGGPGYASDIQASVTGGVTVNSVTYTDPTHVTLDLDTTGATNGSQNVTITNPDGQSATGENILVTGSDTTPPDPPVLTGTDPASPSNVNTPRIIGTAEGGSTVKIYTDSSCTPPEVASGSAAGFASPGIQASVTDNSTTTFYATATDISNNTSACSTTSVTYVEDSIAPATPTGLSVTPSSPANDNSPVVSGTADAGTTVKLYDAVTPSDCTVANLLATGTAADFGSPGLTAPVADDTTTVFRATASDDAGNTSACSTDSVTYVEDSTPPAAPSGLAVSPSSPANDPNPVISGSAESGSTVKVYAAATTSDCTLANLRQTGTDTDFASPGLGVSVASNSTTTFRATATDAAGNTSTCSSSSVTYVEDEQPPALPDLLASSPPSPANENSPQILGSAEANSTVRLYTDASCTPPEVASGTAAQFASPGITVSVADDSTTTFHATATDQAGNPSGCSSSALTYVEDSQLPVIPAITATSPSSPSSDTTPMVIGTASANTAEIDVFTQANCAGPATTGSRDRFVGAGIQVAVGANQTTLLSARARNAHGASSCSPSFAYANTPPGVKAPPDTAITKGPKKTRKRRPKFKFISSDPAASFRCKLDKKKFKPCTSPYRPPKLKLGKHILRVVAVDAAGNVDPTPAVRKFRVVS